MSSTASSAAAPAHTEAVALSGRRRALAALLAGALTPLAFAPFHWFPLALLGPAVMFRLWQDSQPRAAFRDGWLFGLGLFGVGVSWVYVAIHDYGFTSAPVAALLTAIFVAGLALLPGALGALCALLQRTLGARRGLLLVAAFPAAWLLLEWVRGWILTGFPWLQLGYAFIDTPLADFAPWAGVYAVTWAAAVSAGLLLYAWQCGWQARELRRGLLALGALAGLWAIAWAAGQAVWTAPAGKPLRVAVVQGNLPQETKWDPAQVRRRLQRYAELTREHLGADLIVWPENAMTVFYHQIRDDYLLPLAKEVRAAGGTLILGVPVEEPGGRYYAALAAMGETPLFYFKRHLVPFGEYVPLGSVLRGLVGFFDLPMSGFSRGHGAPLLMAGGEPLGMSLCYEDAFGEDLLPALPTARLLVNGSNNAWYGDSLAPHQHLQISRMRSLETGRDAVRATTTGISALIDHRGRLVEVSPQFRTAVLTGSVQPRRGATPYVRVGNLPVIAAAAALVLGALLWGWRRGGLSRRGR